MITHRDLTHQESMRQAAYTSDVPLTLSDSVKECGALAEDCSGHRPAPELSVIVPTFNEAENLGPLISNLRSALRGTEWELLIVDDDSPDQTFEIAKLCARADQRIRCLRRVGRRGLAGACIEGILASSSPYVAVLDGDLQHDEAILPEMLNTLKTQDIDLVVGTRHRDGGSANALHGARRIFSQVGTHFAKILLNQYTSDPMSGYFMLKRSLVEEMAPRLSTDGFKILADILATSTRELKIAEVPYFFRPRTSGQSKLDAVVLVQYVGLLLKHLTNGFLPTRFLLFGVVGASGLIIHMAVLDWAVHTFRSMHFAIAECLAIFSAMFSNFIFNNWFTYRDVRHRNISLIPAFVLFCAVCSVGALSSVSIATWIYSEHKPWWIAGLAGALTGSLWNYQMSTSLVWSERWRTLLRRPE